MVEGAGGPSWYTEYNVLTGLSARSYGRFADFVTRIAAGRVERGLPHALRRCGYKTFTFYPMYGAFLGARNFQQSTGIQNFLDSAALRANFLDPDAFYFNKAADTLAKERGKDPLFMLVYTAQNHFPWDFRFRPDLAPDWRDLGNRADVDEYLRRQHLSAVDYQAFVARLKREFPEESFLIVRFGDHQPYFARSLIDPSQDDSMIVRRIAAADPALPVDLLRHQHDQLHAARPVVGGGRARCAVSSDRRDGGGGRSARCVVRRAEEDPAALPRAVLSLQWRRRGAPLQPDADRRRADQGAVGRWRHPPCIRSSLPRMALRTCHACRASAYVAMPASRAGNRYPLFRDMR